MCILYFQLVLLLVLCVQGVLVQWMGQQFIISCFPSDSELQTYICHKDNRCSFTGKKIVQAHSGERCCRDEVGFVAYSLMRVCHNCSELQNTHTECFVGSLCIYPVWTHIVCVLLMGVSQCVCVCVCVCGGGGIPITMRKIWDGIGTAFWTGRFSSALPTTNQRMAANELTQTDFINSSL